MYRINVIFKTRIKNWHRIHNKTKILSTTGMLLGSLLLLSLISSCVADVIRREPVLFRTVIIGDLIHYRSTNFCRNFCQTYQLLTEFQPEFIAFRNVLFLVVGGWTWFSRGSNSMWVHWINNPRIEGWTPFTSKS